MVGARCQGFAKDIVVCGAGFGLDFFSIFRESSDILIKIWSSLKDNTETRR